MGRLAMPSLLAQAAAPWVGALLLERIGAHGTMAVVASVAALNVALTIGLGWMVARHRFVFAKPRLLDLHYQKLSALGSSDSAVSVGNSEIGPDPTNDNSLSSELSVDP
jgi:hypothetical protein